MSEVMKIVLRTTGRRRPDDIPEPITEKGELLPEPTPSEMVANAADAFVAWGAAGFPVRPYASRLAVVAACDACIYWDANARKIPFTEIYLGKCMHPGCGCTKMKRFLLTSRCPMGKW